MRHLASDFCRNRRYKDGTLHYLLDASGKLSVPFFLDRPVLGRLDGRNDGPESDDSDCFIYIADSAEDVIRKINKAFCPPGKTEVYIEDPGAVEMKHDEEKKRELLLTQMHKAIDCHNLDNVVSLAAQLSKQNAIIDRIETRTRLTNACLEYAQKLLFQINRNCIIRTSQSSIEYVSHQLALARKHTNTDLIDSILE